jgi:gliding motility-associated-like protein
MAVKNHSKYLHKLVSMLCVCLLTFYSAICRAQNITNGLVGYYTFCDCTAKDQSGNNRHGTITGSPKCIPGMKDYGLLLNQSPGQNNCGQRGGEYIQLPQLGSIWAQGFTVCAWIKFDEIKNFERIIDFSNGTGDAGGMSIWFGREGNSNNLTMESWINANGNQARSVGRLVAANAITNGSIEYYCATISSDTMRIYVNGVLVAEKKGNPIANVTRNNNYIGRSAWCANDPDFKGFMDEVRIYNRALSPQEIQSLYKVTNVKDFAVQRVCSATQTSFLVENAFNIDSVKWEFGDPASGNLDRATGLTAVHTFTNYGSYNVRLIVYKPCLNDTVTKLVRIEQTNSFLGNDFEVCPAKPRILNMKADGATHLWQNGSTLDSFIVSQPGLYWLQFNLYNCTYRDSVTVSSARRFSTLNATICEGQNFSGHTVTGTYLDTFSLPNGCDSIQALHLTVKPTILTTTNVAICPGQSYTLAWGPTVTTSGIYRDTTRYINGCDSLIREVNLKIIILAHDIIDIAICANQWYTLPWGIAVNQAGLYRDTVRSNAGCDSIIRSVNLVVKQLPTVSVSKSNDIDCMLGTTRLLASGGTNYKWSPAITLNNASISQPVASPESSTTYHVEVTAANGCSAEDSIQVNVAVNNAQKGLLVPTAFTPGNDGKNDCFGVHFWGAAHNFSMSIFNRWGARVFYTTDNHQCWNGNINGKQAPPGVYIYFISAKTNCGEVTKKGTFILLR